jgi:hypothetical protein
MSQALKDLDDSINTHLQSYLSTPIEDRTSELYDRLVDSLARSAMDYAKRLVEERMSVKRTTQMIERKRR